MNLIGDDFNRFREIYKSLSFNEIQKIMIEWDKRFPNQVRFNRDFFLLHIKSIIDELGKDDINVIELGGHEGHLAFEALQKYPKIKWLNVDMTHHKTLEALEKYNYTEHVLSKQVWEEIPDIGMYDVFISSNTIEHINNEQLKLLLNWLMKNKIQYMVLEIPIRPEGQIWDNYYGSHILEMGSNQIKHILESDYQLVKEEDMWRTFWKRNT